MSDRPHLIDRWMFHEYDSAASGLPIFRICFALIVLAHYQVQSWIADVPGSFYYPPLGPMLLFDGLPSWPALYGVIAIHVLALFALLVGYHTRLASVTFALSNLLILGWINSMGKINHGVLLPATALVLAMSGWGDWLPVDAIRRGPAGPRHIPSWPVALLALVIGLAMFTAAWPKYASGWLDLAAQATRTHIIHTHYIVGRETWFSEDMINVRSLLFWEALDYATVFLEAGMLLAVVRVRAVRVACALACLFHASIFATMRIHFWINVIAYAAVINWAPLQRTKVWSRIEDWIMRRLMAVRFWHLLVATAAWIGLSLGVGRPIAILLNPWSYGDELAQFITLGVIMNALSVAVAIAYLVLTGRRMLLALGERTTSRRTSRTAPHT